MMRKSRSPSRLNYPGTHAAIAPAEHAQATHTATIATVNNAEPQHSQESVQSAVSSTFSAPALPSSSSNLSTATTTETDLTTPSSTNVADQIKPTEAPMPESSSQSTGGQVRAAPRIDTAAANALQIGDAAAGPMPLESPAKSSKRTVDGSLKSAGLAPETPSAPAHSHKRNKSMDTHSGRIGELSAQLKTRLSYAMVKVQNGWEKQSLDELEESQSQRGSPNSAPGRTDHLAFESPATIDRQRRPSGVSDISDQMIMSPASDPTRSLAGTPASYWRPGTRPAMNAAANLISITGAQHGYGLAPAPTFQSGRRRRSSVSHVPPPLLGASQRKHYSDVGAGPRSPATPRAGILRMPSQQAEKDAVDTLLFMSSPNNSQRFPAGGQPAPSPLRAEAPQRRVMFEAYPPQDKRAMYQPSMPAPPHHHQHGPYPAYPAR
ncbi:uncharacterized protein J4E87_010823 [Alternaria ethzedia]|uniref:uncharacterized protein n=1 Tax=Alternaria ethzedia TaxID=181014 RepID=UPI0020C52269|nr:uncharacterized protein J4E87_010823 [Alternaria ethzedia]KAI4610271.1 hypothetical protein J4E87_010823 [Alternaria ethzedia]